MPVLVGRKPTMQRSLINAIIAALGTNPAAALIAAGPFMHLLKAPITIGPDIAIGDATAAEANFTDYAAVHLFSIATGPINTGPGSVGGFNQAFWLMSTNPPVTTNQVYGYYITDTGATKVLLAELFDSPVSMAHLGDFLQVITFWSFLFAPPVVP